MSVTFNQPDMYVTFRDHLKHGNVWTAEVSLPMQDTVDAVSYTHLTLPTNREV